MLEPEFIAITLCCQASSDCYKTAVSAKSIKICLIPFILLLFHWKICLRISEYIELGSKTL